MPPRHPTILLIRPYEQAIVFAAEFLAATGLEAAIIPSPVLSIEPVLPLPDPAGAGALIFTSANAVRIFARDGRGRGLRAYCVGHTTANAARYAGFHAIPAGGTAEALLEMLAAGPAAADAPFLYLHGNRTATDLAGELQARGIPVRARVIYRQVEQPLSDKARRVLAEREVIVPLFSANSAAIFARQVRGLPKRRVHLVCMSRAVADALDGFAQTDIHLAAHPGRDEMIKAIERQVLRL